MGFHEYGVLATSTSVSGQQWFRDLELGAQRVIQDRRKKNFRRSRIAIIDSDIDKRHSAFSSAVQESRIVSMSFVHGLPGDQDNCGHGTHAAHSILKTCPQCTLFIARVYDQGTVEEFESNANTIAQVGINAQMPSTTILTMLSGYTMGNRRER